MPVAAWIARSTVETSAVYVYLDRPAALVYALPWLVNPWRPDECNRRSPVVVGILFTSRLRRSEVERVAALDEPHAIDWSVGGDMILGRLQLRVALFVGV
jgi:hypothetical protein